MLSQQSYFYVEFNPIKPSVIVMDFFWLVFSKGLYFSLPYALFSVSIKFSFLTCKALQTEVVATTFSTCLKLESFMT